MWNEMARLIKTVAKDILGEFKGNSTDSQIRNVCGGMNISEQ